MHVMRISQMLPAYLQCAEPSSRIVVLATRSIAEPVAKSNMQSSGLQLLLRRCSPSSMTSMLQCLFPAPTARHTGQTISISGEKDAIAGSECIGSLTFPTQSLLITPVVLLGCRASLLAIRCGSRCRGVLGSTPSILTFRRVENGRTVRCTAMSHGEGGVC